MSFTITVIITIALNFTSMENRLEVNNLESKDVEIYQIDPSEQDRKMTLGTNENGNVCFSCHLPGSECSTYTATCFEEKWP